MRISPSDGALLERFLGGRGLGARLLYEQVGPQVDPLAPDNLLIFTAGPLCGTAWPTSARTHVTFKSPLTGAYGYSNSGGFFGPELARAGFDALLISGRAPQPVILRGRCHQLQYGSTVVRHRECDIRSRQCKASHPFLDVAVFSAFGTQKPAPSGCVVEEIVNLDGRPLRMRCRSRRTDLAAIGLDLPGGIGACRL